MSIVHILQRQKIIGDEIKKRLEQFIAIQAERKNYGFVKGKLKELEEAWVEFTDNHGKLRGMDEMATNHEYYVSNYFHKVTENYNTYAEKLKTVLVALEEANPDLKVTTTDGQESRDEKEQHEEEITTGGQKGARINLDDMFETARLSLEGIPNKSFHVMMANIRKEIVEYRLLEKDETTKVEASVKRGLIINKWQQLQNMSCELMSGPDYDITPMMALQGDIMPILVEDKSEWVASKLTGAAQNVQTSAKLPKLQVPFFGGEHAQFKSFKELFQRMIGNKKELDDCEKLAYLRGQLKDEPFRLISALPLESSSYATAWKILQDRYENNHLIMSRLFEKLLRGEKMDKFSVSSMRRVTDNIRESVDTMVNFGYEISDTTNMMLYYIVENRIDATTMMQYENTITAAGAARTYKHLMEFLQKRIQTLAVKGHGKVTFAIPRKGNNSSASRREVPAKTSSSFVAGAAENTNMKSNCGCEENHPLHKCPRFNAMTPRSRQQWIIRQKRCVNCLAAGHTRRQCEKSKCQKCKMAHHTMLHIEKKNESTALLGSAIENVKFDHVFLATAIIEIVGQNGIPIRARALLDSGSQLTIITEKLLNKIKKRHQAASMKVSGIGAASVEARKRVSIEIKSLASGFKANLEAFVLKHLTTCQPSTEVNTKEWTIPKNIKLADPNFNVPAAIDIIIGGEIFYKLLSVGMISIGQNLPDLQNTVFGWVVTGKVLGLGQDEAFIGVLSEDPLEKQLQQFWQVEERYPPERQMSQQELDCEEYFDRTTMRDEATGKFIVDLQFLKEPSVLGDSRQRAINRFLQLERRFKKDPQMKQEYVQFMREYEALGHMRRTTYSTAKGECYIIPHHAVRNPGSSTTKLRVVFDASAKTNSNISLNEILAKGPVLQDDLFTIITRFRKHQIVFSADITKMYRQIEVQKAHQKWQLIIWREDENQPMEYYKLKTLTYGTGCASYLAIKSLQTLAKENKKCLVPSLFR